jgi:hypothetical protein
VQHFSKALIYSNYLLFKCFSPKRFIAEQLKLLQIQSVTPREQSQLPDLGSFSVIRPRTNQPAVRLLPERVVELVPQPRYWQNRNIVLA